MYSKSGASNFSVVILGLHRDCVNQIMFGVKLCFVPNWEWTRLSRSWNSGFELYNTTSIGIWCQFAICCVCVSRVRDWVRKSSCSTSVRNPMSMHVQNRFAISSNRACHKKQNADRSCDFVLRDADSDSLRWRRNVFGVIVHKGVSIGIQAQGFQERKLKKGEIITSRISDWTEQDEQQSPPQSQKRTRHELVLHFASDYSSHYRLDSRGVFDLVVSTMEGFPRNCKREWSESGWSSTSNLNAPVDTDRIAYPSSQIPVQ